MLAKHLDFQDFCKVADPILLATCILFIARAMERKICSLSPVDFHMLLL